MSIELDWAAPIVPGYSVMGLVLGTPRRDVLRALYSHPLVRQPWWVRLIRSLFRRPGSDLILFQNSPKLWVDVSEDGIIYLKASEITPVNYPWQNRITRLAFKADRLESIIVESRMGDESFSYRGRLFGKVGLGSAVAELLEFCDLEYDDAEEWFHPTDKVTGQAIRGLLVAGQGAQNLTDNPQQRITFIRIFVERGRPFSRPKP